MSIEIVTFKKQEYGLSQKSPGLRIGNHLVVSPSNNGYRIYELITGKQFIPNTFKSKDDARIFAEWLEKIYADYFILLSEYEPKQMITMCQLSVPYGQEIDRTVNNSNTDIITLDQMEAAVLEATNQIKLENSKNVYLR